MLQLMLVPMGVDYGGGGGEATEAHGSGVTPIKWPVIGQATVLVLPATQGKALPAPPLLCKDPNQLWQHPATV